MELMVFCHRHLNRLTEHLINPHIPPEPKYMTDHYTKCKMTRSEDMSMVHDFQFPTD